MQNKKIIIIGTTASNLYIFRKDFIAACIVKKIDVVVFVSEYTAPDDFACIWEMKVTNSMNTTKTYKPIEKLFKYKGGN